MVNGGIECELGDTWSLWCDRQNGCAATADRDTSVHYAGTAAARITITGAGRRGGVELTQSRRALVQGKSYALKFWARADHPLEILCVSSKGSPGWDNYGLDQDVRSTTQWQAVTLTFEAGQTAPDARIQFLCGGEAGSFWIDEVSLKEHGPEIYRRDFENGLVLLNGTRQRQTVDVGEGYARLKGDQATRHQYILDDGRNPGFKTTGPWREIALGTKEWHAIPPYFHAWNNRCHTLAGEGGDARWDLDLREPGTYTIQAWWGAAPGAKEWTSQAVYEVVAGDKIVATRTLDQTRSGDEWHTLVEGLKLTGTGTRRAAQECRSRHPRRRCAPRLLGRAVQRRQADATNRAGTDGRHSAEAGQHFRQMNPLAAPRRADHRDVARKDRQWPGGKRIVTAGWNHSGMSDRAGHLEFP